MTPWNRNLCVLAFGIVATLPALAQPSPAAAAAAAAGNSTSANGGTGGVGLGGAGPGVAARPDSPLGAGTSSQGRGPGNDALVGPRARKDAAELLEERPVSAERPATAGQRALLLDQERRAPEPPAR